LINPAEKRHGVAKQIYATANARKQLLSQVDKKRFGPIDSSNQQDWTSFCKPQSIRNIF